MRFFAKMPTKNIVFASTLGLVILMVAGTQYWRIGFSNSTPALTMSDKPYDLVEVAVENGSLIVFDGQTSAPEDTLFQAEVRRELVDRQHQVGLKTSMLPQMGDVFYEHSVKLESPDEIENPSPMHYFGRVKNGRLKFKVKPFHPYVQAFGATLDSEIFAFDKFNLAIFKVKILFCKGCKPTRMEELSGVSWVDFKEVRSIPVHIYATSPTKEDIEQIQIEHNAR